MVDRVANSLHEMSANCIILSTNEYHTYHILSYVPTDVPVSGRPE